MRLFNFCGIHRPKKLINTLPVSFTANNTTYSTVNLKNKVFGQNAVKAMYKATGRRGGAVVRVFVNGTITFCGMKSQKHAVESVIALTNKKRVQVEISSVRCREMTYRRSSSNVPFSRSNLLRRMRYFIGGCSG